MISQTVDCSILNDPVKRMNTHLPSLTSPPSPLSINGEGEWTGLYGWAARLSPTLLGSRRVWSETPNGV